jgi:hypothetical protein
MKTCWVVEVSGELHAAAALPRGKSPPYSLHGILDRAQSRMLLHKVSKCSDRACVLISSQICLQTAGAVQCAWHTDHNSLEGDKWCYSKAEGAAVIISFRRSRQCCTVHLQVGISLAACYLSHSSDYNCLPRRPDHIPNLHLQNDCQL